MVQTEDQFVFIYEALLDAVESGCTEVPAESLYVIVQQLTSMYTVDGTDPTQIPVTGMELEFKVICCFIVHSKNSLKLEAYARNMVIL
jgi:hypothetical protein